MTTVLWKVHAYEPWWMPEDDFNAVIDWLRTNDALDIANGDYDLAVIEVDGQHEIHGRTEDDNPASLPLRTEPPTIDRPDIPHLEQLQAVLTEHHRGAIPAGPMLVLGDCLAEEMANLQPGGGTCADCTRTTKAEVQYVAWPCAAVREAAERSGVELW